MARATRHAYRALRVLQQKKMGFLLRVGAQSHPPRVFPLYTRPFDAGRSLALGIGAARCFGGVLSARCRPRRKRSAMPGSSSTFSGSFGLRSANQSLPYDQALFIIERSCPLGSKSYLSSYFISETT